MEIALVVLIVIGAFILGITVSWLVKGYVEDTSKTLPMLSQLHIQKCWMKMETLFTMNLFTSDHKQYGMNMKVMKMRINYA